MAFPFSSRLYFQCDSNANEVHYPQEFLALIPPLLFPPQLGGNFLVSIHRLSKRRVRKEITSFRINAGKACQVQSLRSNAIG